MWAIFLFSAMMTAIAALVIVFIANKVIIAIKKDNFKSKKELEKEGKENE